MLLLLKFIFGDFSGSNLTFGPWKMSLMFETNDWIPCDKLLIPISLYKIYCAINVTNMGHMGISFFVWSQCMLTFNTKPLWFSHTNASNGCDTA